MDKIEDLRSNPPRLDIPRLYARFNVPVTDFDCGEMCSASHPLHMPFCCDICEAVPAAYQAEWEYLRHNTTLWHVYGAEECPSGPADTGELLSELPEHMLLLACQGPAKCQRGFRLLSCRQFPFFPYISTQDRFLGLAPEWEYAQDCWVLNHLEAVTERFTAEFIRTYDELFAAWEQEFDSYVIRSEQARAHYAALGRRMPLLHRNGRRYLVSPRSERLSPQS